MALRLTRNVAQESFALGARQTGEESGHGAASLGTAAMLPNARDVQIVDSTLTMVGGDIHHNHSVHYHYERKRDIWAILQSVPNFRDIYHDMLEKATSGTGMWLVKGDKFRVWLEPNGDIKIFWGSGIPGAGKTVLASIVIECLEALRKESDGSICVCYVYFRYTQRIEVTIRNVLETLVKQTLERHPECRALIEHTYAQHLQEGSEPTVAQLLGLLRELTNRMACTFYVLDALDEAPTKIQLAVVKALASLNAKLFITSRPLETVQAKFPQAHITTIMAQDADLDLHIAKAIDESADLQHLLDQEGPWLKEEIISTVKRNCGGMFLHASLQLEALCECISAQEARRTLKAFPSQIKDVYLRTWDRIHKQNVEHVSLAKAVLVWVLNASRPMTVEELGRAVATSPDSHKFQADRLVPSTSLISLCRGLVTVEEESRLVRLVHYTAKDTLESLLRESYPHPHSLLATVCMTHLTERGFQNTTIDSEEFKAVLKKDPLLAYASEAWAFHAQAGSNVEETRHRTAQFIRGCHAFPAVTSFDQPWYLNFDVLTPVHIAGLYKLPTALINGAVMGGPNLVTTICQRTPLMMASQSGHSDLVARLISLSETQVNLVDKNGCSALIWAVRSRQEGIVKLLLTHPEIQVNLRDNDGWSALAWAALMGQDSIVKFLLAHPGVQVDLVDNNGWSALAQAARAGQEGVTKLLLAYLGSKVNLVDGEGWSALMAAAFEGQEGIMKILLAQPGILVNLVNSNRASPLMAAAYGGHEGVVKLLLAYPGIQVNLVTNNGRSALMLAASSGHGGVVKLLLAYPEVQVGQVTSHNSTALLLAAEHGHTAVVKLLLTTGAFDINAFDNDGDTAIKMAAEGGHEAVVRVLLDTPNVDITIRSTRDGHTAMSAAQAKGHGVIVELLRDFEARNSVVVDPQEIGQLSLHDRTDEEGSDSGSEDAYFDAEEGAEEGAGLGSPICG